MTMGRLSMIGAMVRGADEEKVRAGELGGVKLWVRRMGGVKVVCFEGV